MSPNRAVEALTTYGRWAARTVRQPSVARSFWSSQLRSARLADRVAAVAAEHGFVVGTFDDVVPGTSSEAVSLADFKAELGSPWLREITALCQLVRRLHPQTIFEFGTFRGGTTRQLAANAPAGCTIHTIDLPPDDDRPLDDLAVRPETIGDRMGSLDGGDVTVQQHLGDTRTYDFSPWFGSCDLVFIDAGHEYDDVRADCTSALSLLRPGGVVVWHDVMPWFPGSCRAVGEVARTHRVVKIRDTSMAACRL